MASRMLSKSSRWPRQLPQEMGKTPLRHHRLRRFISLHYLPNMPPVSGSGHPTRAPGHKRLRQETCPLCQHHQGIKLPHRVTMQAHQYNLRILRLQPEWIAKFNLSHDNRHDYDYDYDYAAASLSPKSRLNFQLSCYLTCRLDSISFLPEERIENPGSFLPVDTYTAFHFFLKSELKIQLFFCQSIR